MFFSASDLAKLWAKEMSSMHLLYFSTLLWRDHPFFFAIICSRFIKRLATARDGGLFLLLIDLQQRPRLKGTHRLMPSVTASVNTRQVSLDVDILLNSIAQSTLKR